MPTHIGSININVDTSQVTRASAAISALGAQASTTQALLNRLSTINLGPASASANTLAQQLNNVGQQASQAHQHITALNAAGGSIGGSFGAANTSLSGLISNLTGLGVGPQLILGIGSAAIGLGKSLFDAYQPVQSLRMGLNALGQDGNAAMLQMVNTANTLGVSFTSVSKGLLQFSAATAGTRLEGEKTNEVFAAVAGSVKLFGGGAEQVDGAMKALTQTLGKGTVSSEEIRQQLGEHLPGSFRLAAEAMGMSQAELVKALKAGAIDSEGFIVRLAEVLKKHYGEGMKDAAQTTKSQLAIAGNDWAIFTANLGKSVDAATGSIIRLVNEARILKGLNMSGIVDDAKTQLGVGGRNNGITDNAQAQLHIDAYNNARKSSPNLPEINTTKVVATGGKFGATTVKQLSPAEQWAQHNARMYESGNTNAINGMKAIGDNLIDIRATNDKAADKIKSAEFEKKNAQENLSWTQRMTQAIKENNKEKKAQLEMEKLDRDSQLAIKGAGDNKEKIAQIKADTELKKAEAQNKYTDKTKKGGKLTTAQKQDNKFSDLLFSMESSINSAEVAKETSFLDKELMKQHQIFERNEAKAKQALAAKSITNKQYKTLMDEAKAIFAEGSTYVIQADQNKKAEEAAKELLKIKQHQLQQEQNVLRIYQQQTDEITKAAKESAKRNAELNKLVNNTNRGIGRDLINANPMANKTALQREDYVNKATDPLTNQLDGLQSKMEQLNEVMGREDGITQGMMEDYNNLSDTIDKTKQAIADMADNAGNAFDKMQANSKNLTLAMTGAANAYIQSVDVAKLSTSLASNTVTEFGSTLSEALGSKEGWKNREQGIKNYFASMLKQISNMIIQLGVIKPLMESVFGGASGKPSDGASGWLGAIAKIGMSLAGGSSGVGNAGFGDYSAAGMAAAFKPTLQANGGAWTNGIQAYANGGVFGGEHGIYNKPTFFQHAGGMGVLGEVPGESEGVLPLKRGKNGKLGVIASGGGSSINHNNFSPTIVIHGNADDAAIAKMRAEMAAEFKQYTKQQIAMNNKQSQRPGGIAYRG